MRFYAPDFGIVYTAVASILNQCSEEREKREEKLIYVYTGAEMGVQRWVLIIIHKDPYRKV